MTAANNVIKGPWVGNDPTPPAVINAAFAMNGVNQVKGMHISESLLAIVPMIFHNIEMAGFHFDDGETSSTLKDGTLIVESIKSILFKHYGIHHPLQDVAEELFIRTDDENGLEFTARLDMDIEPPEKLTVLLETDDDYEDDEDLLEE